MKKLPATFGIPDTLPPLGLRALRSYLWFGVTGLLLLALGLFPGVAAVRWTVLSLLVCWIAAPAWGRFRRSACAESADGQTVIAGQLRLYALVVVGFSIAFVVWARSVGLAWPVAIGALFLIDALANLIAALTEWWRLSMLGHSIGLMICGFGFPFVDQGQWAGILGVALVSGSLLSAGILYSQVRHHEAHAPRTCAPQDAA